MKHWKLLLGLALVNLAALAAVATRLPEQIPLHANLQGEIDRWGPRWAAPLPGLLPVLLLFIFWLYRRRTGERAKANRRAENVMIAGVTLLFCVLSWLMVAMSLMSGYRAALPMELLVSVPLGALMLVLGNVMGTIQQPNRWFGVRTKWTLANEEVWRRTHRVSAYCTVVGGLLVVTGGLCAYAFGVPALAIVDLFLAVLLIALVPTFYSWYCYKKLTGE